MVIFLSRYFSEGRIAAIIRKTRITTPIIIKMISIRGI
jgi:hypothetical protein